jgi:CRP-like cAMP-binding protein
MTPLSVAAGTAVITQGDRAGDTFYVIRSGACTVTVDGAQVARLEAGRAFGELALLYSCPRAATVAAAEATQLWVLHQRWYRLVARSAAQLRVQQKARRGASRHQRVPLRVSRRPDFPQR